MLVEAEALLRCQVRWDYPDDDDSDELDAAALQELGCKRLDDPEAKGAKEHSTQASQNSGFGKPGTAMWKAPRVPVVKAQRPPVNFSLRDFLEV